MNRRALTTVLTAFLALALAVSGGASPALAQEEPAVEQTTGADASQGENAPAEAPVENPAEEAPPAEEPADAPAAAPEQQPAPAPTAPAEPKAAKAPTALAESFTPGTVDNGDGTSTYTHFDGETVTYPNQAVPGEPLVLSGTGWLTKQGHQGTGDYAIVEGDEGSITGIKFFAPAGTVIRDPKPVNPWNGDTDYDSPDVWEIAQAAGTGDWWGGAEPGSWRVEVPWPSAQNGAVDPPDLQAGDSFYLQLLSGTLYGNTVGNQALRPDVSRTVRLDVAVVDEIEQPDPEAPSFTSQPADTTVTEGQDARFSVVAKGYPAPSIAWERYDAEAEQWVAVPGATGATLMLAAVTIDRDGERVRAVAVNDLARIESSVATLTVEPAVVAVAPSVTEQPQNVTEVEGGTAVFSAAATGTPDPSVRWESSADGEHWAPVAGAASASLELHELILGQSGTRFRAVFTNEAGSATTEPAVLTVTVAQTAPVQITLSPVSQSIEAGEPVTFTAAATGAPAPAAQWQRSTDGTTWVDLRGATASSYTVDSVSAGLDGARYRAVFSNASSPEGVQTAAATLAVTPRQNVREHCGTSYGPGASNSGIPFCFRGPEKVVYGQSVVIEGVGGYFATDGSTGSVVNFFLDAEYSGDPNTVYSKKLFTNPSNGQTITDRRTHAIVQAKSDGSWRVEIPWPTVESVSPSSDGSGSYTAQQLAQKFAPGTTHSFRMLTGSLLNTPPDRQRGGSLYFTVVESLDDEVRVTEPLYEHQTFESDVEGDSATAWVQQQVNSGQRIALTGTGWLTKDRQWGSTVAVRLQDETGGYYQRSGAAGDEHADPSDPTVWQVVQASELGDLDAGLRLPAEAAGGDFVAVELTTTDDGTLLGDTARHWVSEPVVIDNSPFIPELGEDATCTAAPGAASYELAPGMRVPAANIGGTIRLTGENWCNLVGGGSLIAIKIDDGAYSRLATETAPMFDANLGEETGECAAGICGSNKTIWYTIEADEHGSFDVEIPVPGRKNSSPAFEEGAYTLRIMTRTLSADPYYQGKRPDPSRTMKSPEFTVVAEGLPLDNVKPGRPKAAPDPLHATNDLTDAARGGVKLQQQSNRWLVTIPAAEQGDWVYVNLFDGASPRSPWGNRWFEVDARRQISVPLAGVTLPAGKNKLSVQDRTGALLGWTLASVAAPKAKAATVVQRPSMSGAMMAAAVGQPKPDGVPAKPVASYKDLTKKNAGDVTGALQKGKLTVTLPSVEAGHWVHLFLYTEKGKVVPIDWVQVGSEHTLTVDVGKLSTGAHKLAFVGADGKLVGWVAIGKSTGDDDAGEQIAGLASGAPVQSAGFLPDGLGSDATATLVMLGLAFLVLAGAGSGVIVLRRRSSA